MFVAYDVSIFFICTNFFVYIYTVYLVRSKRKIFNLQNFIHHVAMDSLLCQHGLQAVIWNTNDWWGRKIENPIRNKSEKWDLIFFTYINILKTLLGMSFTFTQNNHSKCTLLVCNINQASWDLSSIKSGISRYWSKHFIYLAKVVSVQKGFVTKIGGNIEWSFKIHSCKINIGYQKRAIYPIYIRTWLELYAVVVFIRGIICNSIQWG